MIVVRRPAALPCSPRSSPRSALANSALAKRMRRSAIVTSSGMASPGFFAIEAVVCRYPLHFLAPLLPEEKRQSSDRVAIRA